MIADLRQRCDEAGRRMIAGQDRNPFSPTRGCLDRRYWAWKLVDLPESTYQRCIHPLAILYRDPQSRLYGLPAVRESIAWGLEYLERAQWPNGSFDQAFHREFSFASTAFLVHPVLDTMRLMGDDFDVTDRARARRIARAGAEFLCRTEESHGLISNHLAGAALSLDVAGEEFGERRFHDRANEFLARIVLAASPEGWLREYDGADPGYQTLAHSYLARLQARRQSAALGSLLERSAEFLSHFVHPDGSFGGLYGSRRTAVWFPAGFAIDAATSPLAARMRARWEESAATGRTVTLREIDMGNVAPLLTDWLLALQCPPSPHHDLPLPDERPSCSRDFPEAGISIRATAHYHAVVGASNGGTLKVVDRSRRATVVDDGGYVGALASGQQVTTQRTQGARTTFRADAIDIESEFFVMPTSLPTAVTGLGLRLLGLTVLRSVRMGSALKKLIVRRLIAPKARVPIRLTRRISFADASITVEDRVATSLRLDWLRFGVPFQGVHMASAGYLQGDLDQPRGSISSVDVVSLAASGEARTRSVIEIATESPAAGKGTPAPHPA